MADFQRTLTLFDGLDTRKKATMMDKWDVMMDDSRNGDFEGLEEFLQWGKVYRITIEEIGDVSTSTRDEHDFPTDAVTVG